MVSKGRLHPRGSSRKSSSSTFIFSVLIICSFFVLILFGFAILSIPKSSSDSSKVHEVNSIVHHTSIVESDDRADQWVEVISWEPRAVVYHNFLVSMSDVEEGGETVFPSAKGNISAVSWWNQLSECGKDGLSVKPKMGDALLFWSMKPDASLDPSSLHGGCPVIKGNKWSSTKWIHVDEYKVVAPLLRGTNGPLRNGFTSMSIRFRFSSKGSNVLSFSYNS
ncbi:Prolyl 4-hydroxylase, alpha subunit [Cynara cardunculus var. scolymus]|uniref:Prolyl 4-hydroxylase, alpha subunit n=1 Tax=Cynara cardunculus var. scolymus TaxID=59895 RepID=A0A103Y5K3_CYNCS|nr:Prolyl 4-hydroxylase, alpha subunit [Cynara cardunculus var. scolymus]